MAYTEPLNERKQHPLAEDGPDTPVRLGLLGGLRLLDAAGRPLRLGNRKDAGLLTFLGLSPGEPHSRDKLAALLWGQSEQARARHSLRQALSSLRRRVFPHRPDAVVAAAETVILSQDAVRTDVSALRGLIRQGNADALGQALELYKGAFLDGVHMREPAFDEWVASTRHELERDVALAGRQLARHALEGGSTDRAIQACNKLIEIDPFDEEAHRMLMECYLRSGQNNQAARQYKTLAEGLRAELGVEPDAETKRVYKQALAGAGKKTEKLSAAETSLEDAFEGFDAFVIYDPDDRFVACNRKFSGLFPDCADLFQPGVDFEDILREMVARGCFPQARDDPEAWIRKRLDCHRRGINTENLILSDGRQMFLSQRITGQGNIAVLFTDVTGSGS